MAVGPVTINGMIQRTQDVSVLKHQEDNKPVAEQQQIQTHMKAQEQRNLKQVHQADDTRGKESSYDAKEKGSNEYQGQSKKNKKSKEKDSGKVILKQGNVRFDMKI